MAAALITINGSLTDETGSRAVTIVGAATLTGLGISGGPIDPYPDIGGPGPQPPGGGKPPNYPNVPPHPEHPIAGPGPFPPGEGFPPVVGGGPILPGPPVDPPEDQSKIEWHAAWTQQDGWITVGIIKPEGPHPTPSQ
jgi:hypothetical protein